jgi:hypothetical protein
MIAAVALGLATMGVCGQLVGEAVAGMDACCCHLDNLLPFVWAAAAAAKRPDDDNGALHLGYGCDATNGNAATNVWLDPGCDCDSYFGNGDHGFGLSALWIEICTVYDDRHRGTENENESVTECDGAAEILNGYGFVYDDVHLTNDLGCFCCSDCRFPVRHRQRRHRQMCANGCDDGSQKGIYVGWVVMGIQCVSLHQHVFRLAGAVPRRHYDDLGSLHHFFHSTPCCGRFVVGHHYYFCYCY